MSEHSSYRDGSAEPPGPLADEAARLVGAAQDWWHRTVRAGAAGNGAGAGIATGSPECCWCPVCQAIATVRGDRPDILERLVETQTALSGLLRALADSTAPGRGARPADQAPADQAPADQAPADQAPADQAPADQSPSDQAPSNQSPSDHSPQDDHRAPRVQKITLNGDPSTSASPHLTAFDAADSEQDAP